MAMKMATFHYEMMLTVSSRLITLFHPLNPKARTYAKTQTTLKVCFLERTKKMGKKFHLHSLLTTQFQCQTHEPAGDLITRLHEKMQRH
jgi:hypothetical protein